MCDQAPLGRYEHGWIDRFVVEIAANLPSPTFLKPFPEVSYVTRHFKHNRNRPTRWDIGRDKHPSKSSIHLCLVLELCLLYSVFHNFTSKQRPSMSVEAGDAISYFHSLFHSSENLRQFPSTKKRAFSEMISMVCIQNLTSAAPEIRIIKFIVVLVRHGASSPPWISTSAPCRGSLRRKSAPSSRWCVTPKRFTHYSVARNRSGTARRPSASRVFVSNFFLCLPVARITLLLSGTGFPAVLVYFLLQKNMCAKQGVLVFFSTEFWMGAAISSCTFGWRSPRNLALRDRGEGCVFCSTRDSKFPDKGFVPPQDYAQFQNCRLEVRRSINCGPSSLYVQTTT